MESMHAYVLSEYVASQYAITMLSSMISSSTIHMGRQYVDDIPRTATTNTIQSMSSSTILLLQMSNPSSRIQYP